MIRRLLATVLLLTAWLQPAWACPLCGDALSNDPTSGGRAALGYIVSIAALLSVPALLLAGIGLGIARRARRHGRVDTVARSR